MKVTNVGAQRIYLKDLKFMAEAESEGRRGEDQYLEPGASAYLVDSSEVLRSALKGDLAKWAALGRIALNDTLTLAGGASAVITHNLGFLPHVTVVKQVSSTWVDATGTYNLTHNAGFTTSTIQNSTAGSLTYMIRIS